jgi:transposase
MYPCCEVVEQLKASLALFREQTQKVKEAIEEKIASDAEVSRKVGGITEKLKGVAVLTVATVLAETGAFAFFSNRRQLCSYAGYDVVRDQSGKREGKTKISKKGNAHLRRCLYFPALNVVSNHMSCFEHKYQRIYERSRIKMKAYTAIQKDLLLLIFTLWKKDRAYDPDYKANQQMRAKITSGDEEAAPSFG